MIFKNPDRMKRTFLLLIVSLLTLPATGQWVDKSMPDAIFDSLPKLVNKKYANIEEYIAKEARLPICSKMTGRAVIMFLVKKDGKISNVMPLSADSKLIEKQAVKLIKKSKKWQPAMRRGKAVDALMTAVIPFGDGELRPSFIGGSTFIEYINHKLGNPHLLFRLRELKLPEVKLIARFAVGRDGYITDIEIENSPNEKLTSEVYLILSESPRWCPGITHHRRIVKVKFSVPINLRLKNLP